MHVSAILYNEMHAGRVWCALGSPVKLVRESLVCLPRRGRSGACALSSKAVGGVSGRKAGGGKSGVLPLEGRVWCALPRKVWCASLNSEWNKYALWSCTRMLSIR